MILLRRHGARLEEQIAGLLHDASHTAFSHLIDWLDGDTTKEDSQDRFHLERLLASNARPILEKYGYNIRRIANHHFFPLLEWDAPDLCADRIDYSVREFTPELAQSTLKNLTIHNNEIVFTNRGAAKAFALAYLSLQMEHWGGYEAISRYKIFSSALRYAINQGWINKKDLMVDDIHVLDRLKERSDKKMTRILDVLSHRPLPDLQKESDPTQKKFRHVDPKYLDENESVRLSEQDTEFKSRLEDARSMNAQGIHSADPRAL